MSNPEDFVLIRGRRLNLAELVDGRLRDPAYVKELRERLRSAAPFPHLLVEGWFHPTLLELMHEEFDESHGPPMKALVGRQESTRRTRPASNLGPASQLYFDIVNSGWFARFLSELIGVDHLIVDTELFGGGLHETRKGGWFSVHCDFDRHKRTGLNNMMVMITYLNKAWQPEWSGALELWDHDGKNRVSSIEPEFGRTFLMPHSDHSYHGHPHPLNPPEGVVRRSVATYYYANPFARIDRSQRRSSRFLFRGIPDRIQQFGNAITPPVLWNLIERFVNR